MGLSTIFAGVASNGMSEALLWLGDLSPIITIMVGVALVGVVISAIRSLL